MNAKVLLAALTTFYLGAMLPTDASAQQAMKTGDTLAGELRAMRSGSKRKRVITYQIKSDPKKLPGADGLCNLETGPETFQLVTHGETEAKALKAFVGKTIKVKVDAVSCSQAAGQLSDAIVSQWSVVR